MGSTPLKMCIEQALKSVPPGGMLYGSTFDDMCERILVTVVEPPRAHYNELDGVPFYILFSDLCETKAGMAFFMNPIVN